MPIEPLRKAVFAVGSLGTRLLPGTRARPKEILPIVDSPLIQYAVEEAIEAGRHRTDDLRRLHRRAFYTATVTVPQKALAKSSAIA